MTYTTTPSFPPARRTCTFDYPRTAPRLLHLCFLSCCILTSFLSHHSKAEQILDKTGSPRIVNIYNFIRNEDYRLRDSEKILFEATNKQLELFGKHQLPATWALQYDALINPKYQKLLKENTGPHDEIGAWWELPRALVEKAGIKWRGDHDWVSTANIAFSPGYSPSERKKMVDVYMADFKSIFGDYPRSVGSWYIDEITLTYMAEKYGIVASCNCKDQVGTDGYTLWGGYWNQAYYPSRKNAYMPAQNADEQIDVPVFRMLGSDPIYQYGRARGISSLEPVYGDSGGSEKWVQWFMDCLVHEPCLAFSYTQAGQENSFGWNAMGRGLEMQAEILAKQSREGLIRVETLAQSGKWFKSQFPVTPPTAFVCLDDSRNEDRKTVWYNSRFYRLNLFWDKDGILVRDIHRFDESRPAVTYKAAIATSTMSFGTLPVVEGKEPYANVLAGAVPMQEMASGKVVRLKLEGKPVISESSDMELTISQALEGGGAINILCREDQVTFDVSSAQGKPTAWTLDFLGQQIKPSAITENKATYQSATGPYSINLAAGCGIVRQQEDGHISVQANPSGRITLKLGDVRK